MKISCNDMAFDPQLLMLPFLDGVHFIMSPLLLVNESIVIVGPCVNGNNIDAFFIVGP